MRRWRLLHPSSAGGVSSRFSAGDFFHLMLWRRRSCMGCEVNAVKFNEYASVVVSAGYDQSVRAWDCRSHNTEPVQNELETSTTTSGEGCTDKRLEKANLVIDIMSSSLSLVAQINETDHFNILKMCDILFSQLCLKVLLATSSGSGDLKRLDKSSSSIDEIGQDTSCQGATEDNDSSFNSLISDTSSMAALLLQGRAVVPMQLVARVPAILFYWPLIQLAGAATDNIALGVSVGSKGRGNLPGATSDIRAALLLLLIAKCTADSTAFQEVDGEDFFRQLLDDTDSRVAYYSSAFLLKRMMTEDFEQYQRMLQSLVFKAQQSNNEKLLENPYLQMLGILHLSNDLGTGL